MIIRHRPALCAALISATLAAASSVFAAPSVQVTDAAVVVRGGGYELRVSKTAGVFDLLVRSGSQGELVSVMRPGGEHGWYGYDLNAGGGRNTQGTRPEVAVRNHARGVTVSVHCLLDPQAGISHLAQYDCLDDCVIVCSRYDGPIPQAGAALVRTGPKLDVDITRLDHYLFHDETGGGHSGELTGRTRDFYVGARPWDGTEAAKEFDAKRPYQMLYGPTGTKLAVVYPFADEIWRGQSRFLQLYRDGGNYWYTGVGATSAFGRDFVVCLYTDDTPDESRLDSRIPALLAEAREAVLQYAWPGNLRELRNAIERAVIFAAGPSLGLGDLPSRVAATGQDSLPGKAGPIEAGQPVSLDQLETEHIRLILRRSPTLDDAARILGIDPSTLYRKRKQLGL